MVKAKKTVYLKTIGGTVIEPVNIVGPSTSPFAAVQVYANPNHPSMEFRTTIQVADIRADADQIFQAVQTNRKIRADEQRVIIQGIPPQEVRTQQ